ncbi:acetyl-CoA C-acyltransferase [Microbulbifer halophilus]|uniref:acetyl-CoA C-acyltransferase n=1 Tax=Microbulbifer halophilus TaxID=453963 RepID=A0ABW5EGN3_9GAMM|nr:acetyl-CoA C-acyltransferase [Microbulbifer halophilus]MCW8128496.1 acetyl-CoA C-acyltransferase [Microbulbifer halophilus]
MSAYIYDGGRTAFGRHGGSLAAVRPDDLLARVVSELVARNPFDRQRCEDLIAGNSNQAGEDCRNVARFAGLLAGLPLQAGGLTVNRLCGSGMAAVADAARCVRAGEGELFVAGGVESMSRAPLVLSKATNAFDRGQQLADTTLGPRFTNPLIAERFGNHAMPETADNIAAELGIGREESDRFAAASQARFEAARAREFFTEEIVPVAVPARRRGEGERLVNRDEHPRPGSDAAALAKLKPLFDGGVVTAGNASGINDGAVALIVGSHRIGEVAGIEPRARVVASAVAGVEPRLMGLGPVPASRKVLARAGLALADMDLIEINEAFAVQVLGCLRQLEIDFADERVNPNGGAIAVGHPLGASGARIVLTAMRQLERSGGRYALVSMCIGVGQGIALVLERA